MGARADAAGARTLQARGRAAAGGASGRLGELQQRAGRAEGWARRGRARTGAQRPAGASARGAQATGGRRAGRHGTGAQGRAAGRTVRAGHGRPGRGLGAGGWQTGPAGPVLVHCTPGSVLARFFGPGSTRYFPESPNEYCSL